MINSNTYRRIIDFKLLHESGCFLLPNPWDVGSAKLFASLGFKALATTSSGYAWSRGVSDGEVSLEDTLIHMSEIADATELPVNADFGNGFASTPEQVAHNVRLAIGTGVASISIEDSTGDKISPLRDIKDAVNIIRSARKTIDESDSNMQLVGRAENFFVGDNNLDDTIVRLKAYADAGADCLYAPGIKTREQITAVVEAVYPKPVNVLIGWESSLTLQELSNLGVRRVSMGGALSKIATSAALDSLNKVVTYGNFDNISSSLSSQYLNDFFGNENNK